MAEPAEQIHARAMAAAGPDGRLPAPVSTGWDIFPWEADGGAVVPKRLAAPAPEQPRAGEPGGAACSACEGHPPERVVWEDEHWVLTHLGAPSGLPLVLLLHTREHLDLPTLDDELASQLGRITSRLSRIIEALPHVGRLHVSRWGDGGSHFHQWHFARPAGLPGVRGSTAAEWDDVLPPGPEDVWRADLYTVATKLANWGGHARA